LERRTSLLGCGRVFGKQVFDPVWPERTAPHAWEQGIAGLGVKFTQPFAQCDDGILAKRGASFLAAFPATMDVSSPAENYVIPAEADEFRDPEAGLNRKKQKRPVPAACPGAKIRRRKQGLDLRPSEECDISTIIPFAGYCKNPLN
jgi:hypothetical protein